MMNISTNSISDKFPKEKFGSFRMVVNHGGRKRVFRWVAFMLLAAFGCLFLPWTQTLNGHGYVTALNPAHRPQIIPAIIGGRIEKWFVQEGDTVQRGDTIVQISEVKDEYFDPQLMDRTQDQIVAKGQAVESYRDKVAAMSRQIIALEEGQKVKLLQIQNKISQNLLKVDADSADWVAARINRQVADDQIKRAEAMYAEGLISLTDLEGRRVKAQESVAKAVSAENKFRASQNELLNARAELQGVSYDYADKLAKAYAEKAVSESAVFEGQAQVAKLQNQMSTYTIRSGFYYITAPQDGYIVKAAHSGLGEALKPGESVVTIMPSIATNAAELYVAPVDLPLLYQGAKIRLIFDGWPALVFSGWPGISTGTYGGKVAAIDRTISANGKYRLLVSPDPEEEPWPAGLRVGSGVKGIALLQDVLVGYEIWRRLNGFPPDFYQPMSKSADPSKAGDAKKSKEEDK